jgi:hypothetical protein
MSTETAAISRELGPLIAQASELGLSALGDMPTVALAVHLMVCMCSWLSASVFIRSICVARRWSTPRR